MSDIPVFINCRDRVRDLKLLVEWLEKAGTQRIILLDNDSAYAPLLAYYEETPHTVYRHAVNLGSRSLWNAEMVPAEPFVYTDPDVVPTEDCPLDAIGYLAEVLSEYDGVGKIGLGLKIDDCPQLNVESRRMEGEWWSSRRLIAPGLYDSKVDTTFAVYRANSPWTYDALRTGNPYVARHLPWYRTWDDLDDEDRYYLERAKLLGDQGSQWARQWRSLHKGATPA